MLSFGIEALRPHHQIFLLAYTCSSVLCTQIANKTTQKYKKKSEGISVCRACSLLNVSWQETLSAQAMPQLGCSPSPHIPGLTGPDLYQQDHLQAHGLAWLWATPRALPSAGAVAAHAPPAALGLLAARIFPDGLPWDPTTPRNPWPHMAPDGGSWSILENFSPLSSVLLPKDSVKKSLLGIHGNLRARGKGDLLHFQHTAEHLPRSHLQE